MYEIYGVFCEDNIDIISPAMQYLFFHVYFKADYTINKWLRFLKESSVLFIFKLPMIDV